MDPAREARLVVDVAQEVALDVDDRPQRRRARNAIRVEVGLADDGDGVGQVGLDDRVRHPARPVVHDDVAQRVEARPRRGVEDGVQRARLGVDQDRRHLRIVDVALFYGERSGGIRTYLDAKARHARATGAFEHHVVVPGPRERHRGGRHELPSLRLAAANGYRVPLGERAEAHARAPAPRRRAPARSVLGAAAGHRGRPRARGQGGGGPPRLGRARRRRPARALAPLGGALPRVAAPRLRARGRHRLGRRPRARLRAGGELPAAAGPARCLPPAAGRGARRPRPLRRATGAGEGGLPAAGGRGARGRPVAAAADRLGSGRGRAAPPGAGAGDRPPRLHPAVRRRSRAAGARLRRRALRGDGGRARDASGSSRSRPRPAARASWRARARRARAARRHGAHLRARRHRRPRGRHRRGPRGATGRPRRGGAVLAPALGPAVRRRSSTTCASWQHEAHRRHRRGPARRRARDLRALRADPRLARRPRDRARHPARHPRARPAPLPRPPPGDGRLAGGVHRARRRHRPARLPAPRLDAPRRAAATRPPSSSASTPTRRAAPSRPAAASCASPACGRAGSSLPPTRTPTRCARRSPASFEWWAGLVRIHAARALDPRPGADARHLERASSAWPRPGWCARAPWPPATCCASTCIRPTSTIRATSARWKACSSVRTAASATPSPTTTSLSEQAQAVLRANWREGVHRDGTPYAFTCPATPRYRHQWHWDSCFHAIAWCRYDVGARARGAAHRPARRARRRLHPAHRVLAQPPALAPGAPLRDPARARQPPHDDDRAAAAGLRVGARRGGRRWRPGLRRRVAARAGGAPRLAGARARRRRRRADQHPPARRVGAGRQPEVRPRLRALRALQARLLPARRALRARWGGTRTTSRPRTTSTSRTCGSTSPTR